MYKLTYFLKKLMKYDFSYVTITFNHSKSFIEKHFHIKDTMVFVFHFSLKARTK